MINLKYKFETTEQRSKIMKQIKSEATTPEIILSKSLWKEGFRYRKNYSKLPGKPDIVISKFKLAIFIDGEFWHGYNWEEKKKRIASNRDYWIPKIEKTIQRDNVNNQKLVEMGWTVVRFWEHDIKKDLEGCIQKIKSLVNKGNSSSL